MSKQTFIEKEFRDKVKSIGVSQSMLIRGNCIGNSPMESFFGNMKYEIKFEGKTGGKIVWRIEKYI